MFWTYDVFVAQASELSEFLTHEQFGFANGGQNAIAYVFWYVIGLIAKVFFEITDLLFKLEDFILKHLKRRALHD